ncbi:hypothetical protein RKLH11_4236 [Rhodobacteraceae bacterium KLH11]|nr:hypothetical protein RKLH11_4236 [Rhodobacteraceae bacterium KLH11]
MQQPPQWAERTAETNNQVAVPGGSDEQTKAGQ